METAELVLRSVWFRPTPTGIAVFDYTLPDNVTQYVLAVRFDRDAAIVAIDMES